MERVDFHIHSHGHEEDKRTIETALQKNVTAVAIFKRGGEILDYYDELIGYGRELGVKVFTGTEFHAVFSGIAGVDLVALDFDHSAPSIKTWVENLRQANKSAAEKQYEFLKSKGFSFNETQGEDRQKLTEVLSGNTSERAWELSVLIAKNPENQALLEYLKKEVPDWEQLERKYFRQFGQNKDNLIAKIIWSLYLAPGKEGYISTSQPDSGVSSFVEAIHKAHGVVLYSPEGHFNDQVWSKLQQMGINGIMGWHNMGLELNPAMIKDLRRQNYLILGGSDYDPAKKDWQIGTGNGNIYLSKRREEDLENYLRQ